MASRTCHSGLGCQGGRRVYNPASLILERLTCFCNRLCTLQGMTCWVLMRLVMDATPAVSSWPSLDQCVLALFYRTRKQPPHPPIMTSAMQLVLHGTSAQKAVRSASGQEQCSVAHQHYTASQLRTVPLGSPADHEQSNVAGGSVDSMTWQQGHQEDQGQRQGVAKGAGACHHLLRACTQAQGVRCGQQPPVLCASHKAFDGTEQRKFMMSRLGPRALPTHDQQQCLRVASSSCTCGAACHLPQQLHAEGGDFSGGTCFHWCLLLSTLWYWWLLPQQGPGS